MSAEASIGKVLSEFALALLERATGWIRRRKPHLHVHFEPVTRVWCIATKRQRDGTAFEMMQLVFSAHYAHTDRHDAIIIVDAHPKGTESQLPLMDKLTIPPGQLHSQQLVLIVAPVVGEKGRPWKGQIVFVDHYHRKYKSEKTTFEWGGP